MSLPPIPLARVKPSKYIPSTGSPLTCLRSSSIPWRAPASTLGESSAGATLSLFVLQLLDEERGDSGAYDTAMGSDWVLISRASARGTARTPTGRWHVPGSAAALHCLPARGAALFGGPRLPAFDLVQGTAPPASPNMRACRPAFSGSGSGVRASVSIGCTRSAGFRNEPLGTF